MLVVYDSAVFLAAGSGVFLGHFCGNYTRPARILSPFMNVVMKVSNKPLGFLCSVFMDDIFPQWL
jgi:hypothetical protein